MAISKLAKKLLRIRIDERVGDKKNSGPSLSKSPSSISHAPTVRQLPQERQTQGKGFSPTASQYPLKFFSLPGEVRNLIYSYAIFPYLRALTIYNCTGTVFSLPIFYISRQMRNEALSYLCASKTIYLSGLSVANDFFATIGEHGICSLRHVIVRCPDAWHSSSEKAELKKGAFLVHLKRATSLQRLDLIIGQYPLSREDLHDLKFSDTSGSKFLIACKNVVNGLGKEDDDDRAALKTKLEKSCNELHTEQAVAYLQTEHKQHGLTEHGGKDVLRLCQVTGVVGKVTDLELPY